MSDKPKVVRIEITLSPERAAALDRARNHEPRASFIKRAVGEAVRKAFLAAEIAAGNPPAHIAKAAAELEALDAASPSHENGAKPLISRSAQRMAAATGGPAPHLPSCKCATCKPPKETK